MTKEEILDYVMSTPENTNRAVLSDILDEYSSGAETHDVAFNVYPVKIICENADYMSKSCNIRFEGCPFKYLEDTDEYVQKALTLYAEPDNNNPDWPREGYLYFRDTDETTNCKLIVVVWSAAATGKYHLSFSFSMDDGATWNDIPSIAQLRSYVSEKDGTMAYTMFVSNKPTNPSRFPFTKGNIIKVVASFEADDS